MVALDLIPPRRGREQGTLSVWTFPEKSPRRWRHRW